MTGYGSPCRTTPTPAPPRKGEGEAAHQSDELGTQDEGHGIGDGTIAQPEAALARLSRERPLAYLVVYRSAVLSGDTQALAGNASGDDDDQFLTNILSDIQKSQQAYQNTYGSSPAADTADTQGEIQAI